MNIIQLNTFYFHCLNVVIENQQSVYVDMYSFHFQMNEKENPLVNLFFFLKFYDLQSKNFTFVTF